MRKRERNAGEDFFVVSASVDPLFGSVKPLLHKKAWRIVSSLACLILWGGLHKSCAFWTNDRSEVKCGPRNLQGDVKRVELPEERTRSDTQT